MCKSLQSDVNFLVCNRQKSVDEDAELSLRRLQFGHVGDTPLKLASLHLFDKQRLQIADMADVLLLHVLAYAVDHHTTEVGLVLVHLRLVVEVSTELVIAWDRHHSSSRVWSEWYWWAVWVIVPHLYFFY